MPALFSLLVVFQGLALGDAVILAWLRRSWRWWAGLAFGAVALPFLLVVSIARLDLLRGRYSRGIDVLLGCLMLAVLAAGFRIRWWAWRAAEARPMSP
jgi:hypothetical protein